jgi:hypothetical protein
MLDLLGMESAMLLDSRAQDRRDDLGQPFI